MIRKWKRTLCLLMAGVVSASLLLPIQTLTAGAQDEFVYDVSFENSTYKADTKGIDFGRNGDQWKRGQSFVALENSALTSVEVKIIAVDEQGAPGDLTAELYLCDPDSKMPAGAALATAELSGKGISASGFSVVEIPLQYDKLQKGSMYAVVLGQKTKTGWYGWYCSYDNSNPNWWQPGSVNPQIKQKGCDEDLPSFKMNEDSQFLDDTGCGDLWLKAHYAPREVEALCYDLSFVNDTYGPDTKGIDFGRAGDQWKRGQTFAATQDSNLESVTAKIIAVDEQGAPGDLTAELYRCDSETKAPVGEALATAELSKEAVSASEFTEVTIPLRYEGMKKDELYTVVLGQKTRTGWYGWYCSYDNSNPEWWKPPFVNPQIKQKGYDEDLASFLYAEDGTMTDDSRCGDLWLKANYSLDEVLQPEDDLATQYQKDMENGGLSFYMDRILARPGVDPSLIEDSGLMTRGRALYTKGTNSNGLIQEFGFGGTMRYIKVDRTGYTLQINGKKASDFVEDTSRRVDYPSHWTSFYTGKEGGAEAGLAVTTKRFITENNTAVTILEIQNTTGADKTVELSMLVPSCKQKDGDTLVGQARVDYKNLVLKASMDGGKISGEQIQKSVTIPAGQTVSQKAQMGFIDEKDAQTGAEYKQYAGYTPEKAFETHVQKYNYWWVENIPSMWVPDAYIQKMIAYRWWIARANVVDAGTYSYPFPTAMEGVFGYNNAIVNAVPWQMDESRYLRSPLVGYGTWADAAFVAAGGIYKDNPAGVWGVKPQHYISKAGWENYKVHGGSTAFLEAMADAGAGDVQGTRANFDADGDYIYDIQYDAWDNDTASLSVGGKQQRIDTAALAWANATAVSEMYRAAGNESQAKVYQEFASQIQKVNLQNSWDADSKQFLMKTESGAFIPFRDINNYYAFMVGMIPQDAGYDTALRVWGDETEFPLWPMYVSNSKDYEIIQNDDRYTDRSRNFSPGNTAITLKMFANVIKEYDAPNITGEAFMEVLKQYTMTCFVNKNIHYPDANEFWNGNPETPYRSWIHHNWHSQYNTLIIENVMGITPRDDKVIELHPIDAGMEAFKLTNVRYHGKDIGVELNRDGYHLYVDGKEVAATDRLCHFTWDSQTGKVTVLDDSGAVVKTNAAVTDFKASSEVEYKNDRVAELMDAAVDYKPGDTVVEKDTLKTDEDPVHTGSYKLVPEDGSDWEENFNLDFGDQNGDQYKRAQMFVATQGGTMTGVQVMIKNKTAAKDVTVELYDADQNGKPGQKLASTVIPVEKIPTDMGIVTAQFTYTLEKGKAYYIILGQESGGEGIYCWALSAKSMDTGVQARQEGYDGALAMYKIENTGNLVNETKLGDYYLEVFYQESAGHVHDWSQEWSSDGESHWHTCSGCGEIKDKASHSGGEANCSAKAKCTVCGREYGQLDSEKHDFAAEFTVDKAPTCTEKGEKSKHCVRCGAVTEVTEIPALGHEYGKWEKNDGQTHKKVCKTCGDTDTQEHAWDSGTVTTPPTDTAKGAKTYTCTVCGETKVQELPALGGSQSQPPQENPGPDNSRPDGVQSPSSEQANEPSGELESPQTGDAVPTAWVGLLAAASLGALAAATGKHKRRTGSDS